jgi:nicotinamidase-related amidase
LLKGFQALKAPILITEQYPEKLGATVQELTQYSSKITPIAKTCFSCYRDPLFKKTLKREYKKVTAVALAGIEAHVCLYQTAYDLLQEGYRVEIVEDAISSRTASNREIGIKRILQLGAFSTSVEMSQRA